MGMRSGIFLRSQHRLERQFFWLCMRSWSDRPLGLFTVGTAFNPADPPSRLRSFQSGSALTTGCKRQLVAWNEEPNPFFCLDYLHSLRGMGYKVLV